MKPDDLMTTEQVAALLRVNIGTVRLWLSTGKLKGVKLGKRWYIRREDMETMLTPGGGSSGGSSGGGSMTAAAYHGGARVIG